MKRKFMSALILALVLSLAFSTATFAHDGENDKDKDHDKVGAHKEKYEEGSGTSAVDDKIRKDHKEMSSGTPSEKDSKSGYKKGDKKDEGSGSKGMRGN